MGGNDSLTGFSSFSFRLLTRLSCSHLPTHLPTVPPPQSPVRPKFSSSILRTRLPHPSPHIHHPFSPLSELLQPKQNPNQFFFIYIQISTTSKKVKQGFLEVLRPTCFAINRPDRSFSSYVRKGCVMLPNQSTISPTTPPPSPLHTSTHLPGPLPLFPL